jgi:hypothetical protein
VATLRSQTIAADDERVDIRSLQHGTVFKEHGAFSKHDMRRRCFGRAVLRGC